MRTPLPFGLFLILAGTLFVSHAWASDAPDAAPPPAAAVISTFDAHDDGWRIVGDAQSGSALPQWNQAGGNPGGFLSSDDDVTGGVWYWQAPSQFLGNRRFSYQQTLTFDLRQSSEDSQFDSPDVILGGADLILEFDTDTNPASTWTSYSVLLSEAAGWTVRGSGAAPSASQMLAVLSNLTDLHIRGEFRDGPDTGGLDNVVLNAVAPAAMLMHPLIAR